MPMMQSAPPQIPQQYGLLAAILNAMMRDPFGGLGALGVFSGSRQLAPASFHAMWDIGRGKAPLALFNLTDDILDPMTKAVIHPKGSTITPETMIRLGLRVPPIPR